MNQPKNTLDQWEADAKIKDISFNRRLKEFTEINGERKRILALIDLVRKKDEALKFAREFSSLRCESKIKEALELTEELK